MRIECELNNESIAFKNETDAIIIALEWVLGVYEGEE